MEPAHATRAVPDRSQPQRSIELDRFYAQATAPGTRRLVRIWWSGRGHVQSATVGIDPCGLPHALTARLTRSYHPAVETTKLSSKGQVVLPKAVREAHGWAPGTEFEVESTSDGVRLRAKAPFPRTDLAHVFGSVRHSGPKKTLEQMDDGIGTLVARQYRRGARR